MDITQTATTPPLFSGQSTAEAASQSPALSSDFETFLKMLTVQMENQDPLNPVDSADYAVQLATFSSVEQQVLTNDLLAALTTSMTGGGIGALGQWVGMDVRGGAQGYHEGAGVDLALPVTGDTDRRVLVIRDETGSTVARLDVPISGREYNWDGALSNGTQAPSGAYVFSVESFQDGALSSTEPAVAYNRVKEARIENGTTQLVLAGDVLLTPDQVTGLRDPGD